MKKLLTLLLISPIFLTAQKSKFYFGKTGDVAQLDTIIHSASNSASLGKFYLDFIQSKKNGNNNQIDSSLISDYCLKTFEGKTRLSFLFTLKNESYISTLQQKGMIVKRRSSGIHSGYIDIDSISAIINDTNFISVDVNRKAESLMDEARSSSFVNYVQDIQLTNQSYYGENVVVGIIDIGFDFSHPNFFDETGSNNFRVKRVWNTNSSAGLPPSGFIYGTELASQTDIVNAETDLNNESHGTHVAGIAGGSGGGANLTFQGVAPKSDLVFVSTAGLTDIADGIDYIVNYAASVNKPCVINLSLGVHEGPHDGTSLLDQHFDSKSGEGVIIVGAAGNEGADKLHLKRSFSSNNTTMYSLVQFPGTSEGTNGETTLEIWGSNGATFSVAINIFNTNTGLIEDYTPYYSSKDGNDISYVIQDGDFLSDNCIVDFSSGTSPFNNSDVVRVDVDFTAQDDDYRYALLEIICTNGTVHAWASNSGEATFSNGTYIATTWQDGDVNSTVGEIGGTANSIITVGAYTSKNDYYDFNSNYQQIGFFNSVGELAPFSSKGPTADGRIKPDITAPGNVIISSVNSFDANYDANNSEVVSGVTDGNKDWWFASMQGTSMSSPMVTGIVALLLEADPTLTPSEIKTLLSTYSNMDSFTGYSLPDNDWGHGKIDAYRLLNYLENSTVGFPELQSDFRMFPNPATDIINIESEYSGTYKIYNLQGAEVKSGSISLGINSIDLQEFSAGLYNIQITTSSNQLNQKFIKK